MTESSSRSIRSRKLKLPAAARLDSPSGGREANARRDAPPGQAGDASDPDLRRSSERRCMKEGSGRWAPAKVAERLEERIPERSACMLWRLLVNVLASLALLRAARLSCLPKVFGLPSSSNMSGTSSSGKRKKANSSNVISPLPFVSTAKKSFTICSREKPSWNASTISTNSERFTAPLLSWSAASKSSRKWAWVMPPSVKRSKVFSLRSSLSRSWYTFTKVPPMIASGMAM
mmetsp:Transcript_2043/g.5454  ORF Transcript_2043/g.5454 Transcript_2043/m.5454 type:complete len:232 (-) Transcript_2043:1165-1860(-)